MQDVIILRDLSNLFRIHSLVYKDVQLVAFSPRVSSIALYLSGHFYNREQLLGKLGKHKTYKGCIHLKKLADINIDILTKMILSHVKHIKELYG